MQSLLPFDHLIAASDAFLGLPEAAEGIAPGAASLMLTRSLGPRLTRQIILGERRIRATEPAASLVVDEVTEPGDMEEAIDRSNDRVQCPAIVVNRRMLNLAEESLDEFHRYMAEFAVQQVLRLYSQGVTEKAGRFSASAGMEYRTVR